MGLLKFLGTGSAFNVKRGATSAYFIIGTELFVIDCGEDVFKKLVDKNLFDKKTRVNFLITHTHGDHVGSLSTAIFYLYYKVFDMDNSKICVYFPNEDVRKHLALTGVTEEFYTYFLNKWDELYPDGTKEKLEYNFVEAKHSKGINCYSITIELQGKKPIYYSGDNSEFNFTKSNIDMYENIYNEVTFVKEAYVHLYYERLLEATSEFTDEQKQKIVLMHLEDEADIELLKKHGFTVAC